MGDQVVLSGMSSKAFVMLENEEKIDPNRTRWRRGLKKHIFPMMKDFKSNKVTYRLTVISQNEHYQSIRNKYQGMNKDANERKDELDIFGEVVTSKIRKLNQYHQIVAQHYINSLLFDLELREMSAMHGRNMTSPPGQFSTAAPPPRRERSNQTNTDFSMASILQDNAGHKVNAP